MNKTLLPQHTLTEMGLTFAHDQGLIVSAANTILSPGKFEGEHVSILAMYEAMLDGGSYPLTDNIDYIDITPTEAAHLGNPNARYYLLETDNQGFVRGDTVTDLPDYDDIEHQDEYADGR